MFLRRTRSGARDYLQLVESYRTDAGVRQRVLFSFGRIDEIDRAQIDTLIRGLERYTGGSSTRTAPTPELEIQCEPARSLGDTWVLWQLWKSLGLFRALRRALGARRAMHEPLLRAMVFHRLCDPGSKLGTLRWLDTAVVPGVASIDVNHSALLHAMDALEDVADALQTEVLKSLRPLLDQRPSVVFYDLTTVRAEGESTLDNDLRAVGHSKDRDIPSRQVVIGVVQSACGLPLMHTVHKGNVAEASTLIEMLRTLKSKLSIGRVVVVADRGLMNQANLDALAAEAIEVEYILAVPARRYVNMAPLVQGLAFAESESSIKECRDAAQRRLIVARDAERAADERARRNTAIAEIEALATDKVTKLEAQEAGHRGRGRALTDASVYHSVQSLVEEHSLSRIVKTSAADGLFSYHIDDVAKARAEAIDGVLMLVTSVADMDKEAILERYKALADIERGFRVLKQDIEIAPMFHRLPERIRAHSAICFLALVLHRHLRQRLRANKRSESPDRMLEQMRQIQLHRLTVGQQQHTTTSQLSSAQRAMLEQLDLPLPSVEDGIGEASLATARRPLNRRSPRRGTKPTALSAV